MKKLYSILFIITTSVFAATDAQMERYFELSGTDEQLIEMEKQFATMQKGFRQDENSTPYDMQLVSIRFKSHIQKNISEEEMTQIIDLYKNVLLLRYVSAITTTEYDQNKTQSYIQSLKEEEQGSLRIELVNKISDAIYSKESMEILFDSLMKPLIQNSKQGKTLKDSFFDERKERYIDNMMTLSQEETLFVTKEFTIEELEELLKVVDTPTMGYESKAVSKAMAYALQEFFLAISHRYDVTKH